MSDLEEVKKLLPSLINYDELYSYGDLGLDGDCVHLKQKIGDKDDIKNFHKICMSITGVIDLFSEISIYNSFDNNKCTVFALWMYDYLIKELMDNYDYSKIKKFINIISPIFKRYSRSIGCNIPSYVGIEKYVGTLKTLYDFAINYDTIVLHIHNNGNECSDDFAEYINEKVKLLNQEKENCAHSTQPHCQIFNDIFKQSKIEKLLTLECIKVGSQRIKEILDAKLEGQSSIVEEVENSAIVPLADINPEAISHVQEKEVQIATNEIPSTNNNVMRTILPVVGSAFTMSLLYRVIIKNL
ncbi:hypothetical protein PVIIG_05892 [Plasmodium vivax India VII]|uniref:Variable surface protein n=1 Tax=Plasmodium vivax India VII TaxID=1077284 RepID=A0A0J9S233_PLAVI|nr:hypothetical protein PVIIG_05892 [Plasmodium vivax India VII]